MVLGARSNDVPIDKYVLWILVSQWTNLLTASGDELNYIHRNRSPVAL